MKTRCLQNGDAIPKSSLILLGTAPASARSFEFALAVGETCWFGWLPGNGPQVASVVLQAVKSGEGSPFAIAGASPVMCGVL